MNVNISHNNARGNFLQVKKASPLFWNQQTSVAEPEPRHFGGTAPTLVPLMTFSNGHILKLFSFTYSNFTI
jgi:hypothetical protein